MRNSQAITAWCDESSFDAGKNKYHIIGMLITNSDTEELNFLGDLKNARKKYHAWNVLHGCELKVKDRSSLKLLREWIDIFKISEKVYFHILVYRENEAYMKDGFEKYFAKQSAFGLGCKMKKSGFSIETIFSNVGTVVFLFDKRRDEINGGLGSEYKDQIKTQLRSRSKRGDDITVRFSFVGSECFDAMQLTDVLLYMVKLRIDKEFGKKLSNRQKNILKVWEDNFLDDNIRELKNYEFDEKFNYFFSNQ